MTMNRVLPRKARRDGNSFMVNEGAPDLFPVMSLVKERFTRREGEETSRLCFECDLFI